MLVVFFLHPPGKELLAVGFGEVDEGVSVAGRLDGGQGGESAHPAAAKVIHYRQNTVW